MSAIKNFPTIWFTGLSASGKSTLSKSLYAHLTSTGFNNIVNLDGDVIREKDSYFKYDEDSRYHAATKKAKVASGYNELGYTCIASGISHLTKTRDKIRTLIPFLYEIHLSCPVHVCAQRDFKGNYSKAIKGEIINFVGVDLEYQPSLNHDLSIDTSLFSIEQSIEMISKSFLEYFNEINA